MNTAVMFILLRKSMSRITNVVDFVEARADKRRQGIDDDDRRLGFVDFAMHRGEVKFEAVQRGTHAFDSEQSLLDPPVEVQAH